MVGLQSSRDVLYSIGRERAPRTYAKDELVFAQGDPAESVFYLTSGRIKLATVSPSGKEAVSGILSDGSFFGEGCLENQAVRAGSALTLVDSSIVEVRRDVMQRALIAEPRVASLFMHHLLARNARYESDLVDHLLNSSEKRLARILLLLADFGSDTTSRKIVPKISQETLAEMVGTTRSRVSFFLNKFRKLGFIDYDDAMQVNASLLQVLLHD
jgi:CRP-like cAMP-binding protein